MTLEDMEAMYNKVDNIPTGWSVLPLKDRLHPSRRMCGYMKVCSLMEDPSKFDVHAEHDKIYLCGVDQLVDVKESDVYYLSCCGVHLDEEFECLYHHC